MRERVMNRKEGGKGYLIRERRHRMLDRMTYIVGDAVSYLGGLKK